MEKRFGNSERVISGLGPARLNIGKPCGGIVLHEPPKLDMYKGAEGLATIQDTFPKATQPYQVFFFTGCNGHPVGLDLDGGIGRKSQLQPNSVWSWPFQMQSTNKLQSIFQRI